MAEFLNTSATTFRLEELIKSAGERLILISPYLKVNPRIRELIEDRDRMKIDIRFIYGKSELHPDVVGWLESLPSVRASYRQNLHAKCYLNEARAIITSMNLYEFSQVNNDEMGILIDREQDPALYREAYEEAQRLLRGSEEIRMTVEKVAASAPPEPKRPETSRVAQAVKRVVEAVRTKAQGTCIRCGSSIKYAEDKPLCASCYGKWAEYSNPTYAEKYCHSCGEKSKTSMSKPLCRDCYKVSVA